MTGALSQTHSQRQILAPQMRQGIKMLAMSLPELRSELIAEMAKNPVIDDIEPTLEKTTVSERERQLAEDERVSDYPEDDDIREAAYMDGIARGKNGSDPDAMARREKFFENQVREETLEQHLVSQLPASDIEEADYPLAEMLIGELNDDGLFVGSLPDIVMVSGEPESKVRSLLAQIRELDPPGCGATTLAECLSAQLDKIDDPALRARVAQLIGKLEAVAAGQVEDAEALVALRTLDPRPGRAYRHDVRGTEYVNPEVHAVRCADGWVARVDARSLPEIRISSKYVTMLEDPETTAETKAYIRERIAAANAIVDAVAHRRDTIAAIAQEIFDRQPGFFEQGLKGLKPLTMQEVADKLGIHYTTVSRTVNGKYASTPKGVIELRRFFSQGIVTDSGEAVVKDRVLDRLRAMVEAEDKAHPLSDEKLSDMLKGEGFPVARRTVAKYRGLAGIPGTSARRAH